VTCVTRRKIFSVQSKIARLIVRHRGAKWVRIMPLKFPEIDESTECEARVGLVAVLMFLTIRMATVLPAGLAGRYVRHIYYNFNLGVTTANAEGATRLLNIKIPSLIWLHGTAGRGVLVLSFMMRSGTSASSPDGHQHVR
jgi:hypothetical protein